MNKLTTGILLAALCASFTATAARPSINSLQQQINVLNARINDLEVATSNRNQLVIVDSNNVVVGYDPAVRDTWNNGNDAVGTYFSINGRIYVVRILNGEFAQGDILYDQINCNGNGYVYFDDGQSATTGVYRTYIRDATAYGPVSPPSTSPTPLSGLSMWMEVGVGAGECVNGAFTVDPGSYSTIEPVLDLSIYTTPLHFILTP